MFYCVFFFTFQCGILGQVWYSTVYRFLILAPFSYFVTRYYGLDSLRPLCQLNIFVLHQQQNLEQTFGTSKMHLSPLPLSKAAVHSKGVALLLMISTPIVGFCYCSVFCAIPTNLLTYYLLTRDRRQALAILLLRRRPSSVGENQCSSRCSVEKYTVKPPQLGR